MNKQLLIGSLLLLPAGLNAMDWTPYHNLGTAESMRAIAQRQIDEIRAHNEMVARQIQAQNQIALEIAAEQKAAQAAAQQTPALQAAQVAAQPASVKEVPNHIEQEAYLQKRYYADRTEVEQLNGTITVIYKDNSTDILLKVGSSYLSMQTNKFVPGAIKK
jgi:hypothetical protein